MKQKLGRRKFSNGFYPVSSNETDIEEMADKESDDGDKDTITRLTEMLGNLSSNQKIFTTEDHGEMITEVKKEILTEKFQLTSLDNNIESVSIYRVTQWSKDKIDSELSKYKVRPSNILTTILKNLKAKTGSNCACLYFLYPQQISETGMS